MRCNFTDKLRWLPLVWLAIASAVGGCVAQEAVDYRRIVTDLSDSSMQGRGAGTAGLDRAKDYIVEAFKSAGLRPAFTINEHPSFTQPFEIKLGVRSKHQSLTVGTSGNNLDLSAQAGEQFNALGFSADGTFESEAVFVGYGIIAKAHQYNSYAGIDPGMLHGKVVVAFRYEPQGPDGKSLWAGHDGQPGRWSQAASLLSKAQWAADHGATALLVVNPPSQDQGGLKSTRRSIAADRATIPVLHISASFFDKMLKLAGRDPGQVVPVYQDRADRGERVVESLGTVVVQGRVELEYPRATIANIAGVLPGCGDLAKEFVVLGAHYDHLGYGEIGSLSSKHAVHPGADDNASGVAGLIGLARRLSQVDHKPNIGESVSGIDAGGCIHPWFGTACAARTVLFVAFSGEERGLLGSSYLMKHLDDLNIQSRQMVAMINFDMIGRMTGQKLHIIGVGSADRWEPLIAEAIQGNSLNVQTDIQPFGGSDHMSFLVHEVPAVHIFTGSHSDYHRISDTADKINVPGALKVMDLVESLLHELRIQPQNLVFQHTSSGNLFAAGQVHGEGGAFLGIVPDYASMDGDQGCALSGVVPGSPAKEAGLRANDIIVRWNDKPVANVRSLSARLGESQPGEEVVIQIQRDGKLVQVSVILGQRSR